MMMMETKNFSRLMLKMVMEYKKDKPEEDEPCIKKSDEDDYWKIS